MADPVNDLAAPPGTGAPVLQSVSQRLAEHIAGTRYEQLPAAAIDAAKLFMLDTLAVAWAGSSAPGCREANAQLADDGGRADSTAWAYGSRLPAAAAAFVNGMSSAALDYDCLGRDAPAHVNIVVLPASLAAAEREHASGRDFLAALIIGSDIMCRMATATKPPHRGFHYTSAFGPFAAAATAAKLFGLDAAQTRHALGIAFVQAGGTQQTNIEPSLSKRMLSAFAARAGVFAASLARRGITAPSEVFEGHFGFYNLYQDGDPALMLDGLGKRYENANLIIKKFPSCGCNHTTIAAMLELVFEYDLQPDDVNSIEVTIGPYLDRIVGGPYDPSGDPQVAAQFSILYAVACALVRRRFELIDIEEAAARDPAIFAQIPKISLKVEPSYTGDRGPVIVKMSTRRHGALERRCDHVPGSAESPLSGEDIAAKLNSCFRLGVTPLSDRRIALLRERVGTLEKIDDMAAFFDGLC